MEDKSKLKPLSSPHDSGSYNRVDVLSTVKDIASGADQDADSDSSGEQVSVSPSSKESAGVRAVSSSNQSAPLPRLPEADSKSSEVINPPPDLPSSVSDSGELRAVKPSHKFSRGGSSMYASAMLNPGTAKIVKTIPKVGGIHTPISPDEAKKTKVEQEKTMGKVIHLPQNERLEEENRIKTNYLSASMTLVYLLFMFLFMVTLCLTFLWPEYLPRLGLNYASSSVLMLAEIAVLLLVSSSQVTFSVYFRWAVLLGGLLVTTEALIMSYFS
ncbi:MAG: hypothetical protein K6A35_10050 [bacterium]|nr:hypothetical protein [bacterium]